MVDQQHEKKPKTKEERVDEGLDQTFPASDPPAHSREPQPAEKPDPKK